MKHQIRRLFFLAVISGLTSLLLAAPHEGYSMADAVVVANKSVPYDSITKVDMKKILINKKTQWANGERVVLVTLKWGNTHEHFIKKYTSKSPSQFWSYWRRQVFTGQGTLPKTFEDEEKAVDYIAQTEGALGYISYGTPTDTVKTLTVTK